MNASQIFSSCRICGFFIALGAGLLSFSGSLRAEEIVRESFRAPEGELPQGWMALPPSSAQINADAEGFGPGLLQRRSEDENSVGHSVVFLGAEEEERRFSDCSGTVVLVAPRGMVGLVLRAVKRQYARFEGYFIAVNPAKGHRALQISYSPVSHVDHGEILASTPLPFDVGREPLVLKFSAKGSRIEASLFHWNGGKPDFQSPIAAVQIDDAMTDVGSFGFRSAFGNVGWVVWKDLELAIQP